jgi:transposase
MRLRRAKTDRIDAQLIAACTVTLDPQTQAPPEQRFDALADHLVIAECATVPLP